MLNYGLKLKIKDVVKANSAQINIWLIQLKSYVNKVMSEDNINYSENAVSRSQVSAWADCFHFISINLSGLSQEMQMHEIIFEYSLPGTVHERPDVFLLTDNKAISLEFKRKKAPQVDDNKDDVAQAIRYKEWLENHHRVTKERGLIVKSYLVCTNSAAVSGNLRGVEILTGENFLSRIKEELDGENKCSFIDEWLSSAKTEMPDMLRAIERMYSVGEIPYISDVNRKSLDWILKLIQAAKYKRRKILILINGVPGAGKTAIGQSIVFEENRNGEANAVYLSGNGPLVEVLQYQINQVGGNRHMAENSIQGMKEFKSQYFKPRNNVPQQSILIFDEAQRAWDAAKLKRGYSEPEGLFDVGERIYNARGYVVIIGLYGNGQVIYTGEEAGISLWNEALHVHNDWFVISSPGLGQKISELKDRQAVDDRVFLPVSLRADFIDCSKWVEQAIGREYGSQKIAKEELLKLQNTSMRILVTRDFSKVKERIAVIKEEHPEWRYGILISNFAEQNVINKAMPNWDIGYNGANAVQSGGYGEWFSDGCKYLEKACSVYGNQGLELDCPIILFGGDYIRQCGKWIARGSKYMKDAYKYNKPENIVENNFRVLLTRARREMILLIPRDSVLDETYKYFIDMGVDKI